MLRRDWIKLAAAPALAAPTDRKRVALIITEYRHNAHADVIGTRLLEGYERGGKRIGPRVQVVSMFTDQVPRNDMSRAMAKKNGVPLFDTVEDALTMRKGELAVDGVILIGEHGNYPYNEKNQHLYPRHDLMAQVVSVFRSSRRAVPVFCDKHLSTEWWKAKEMYDWSRKMKFPFMAGSSIPVAWRRPELELPLNTPLRHAAAAAYGGTEAYGFHAIEGLQCMAERRKGGESGMKAVRMIEGSGVWQWTDANAWAAPLAEAACATAESRKPGSMRDNAKSPALFVLEYRDGLQGAVYMLNGHINDFTFAGEMPGAKPAATCFWLQNERFYAHFSSLVHWIEELMITGRESYPVERTLLTTGVVAALMESAWRGHERIETPHLNVRYRPPKESLFDRGPVPAPEKRA